MTHHSVPRAIACAVIVCTAIAAAADLQDDTGRAYDGYAQRAAQLFLERVRGGASATGNGPLARAATPRDGEVVAGPAREDGITAVSGGLVHHWLASTFIPGGTLEIVLGVFFAS